MSRPSSRQLSPDPWTTAYSRSSVGASSDDVSLFDADYDTGYSASSDTEYSVGPGQLRWTQQLAFRADLPPQPSEPHLWCELEPLLGCSRVFLFAEKETWINHHLQQHLGGQAPSSVMCWFCDDILFSSPRSQADRVRNFYSRMNHIYEHILNEGRTLADIRPDFFMVKHLLKRRILPNDQADILLGYDERPDRLRPPPEPFLETRSNRPSSSSYNQGVPHDIAREERHRRRRRERE